jgi:hypothetical protein
MPAIDNMPTRKRAPIERALARFTDKALFDVYAKPQDLVDHQSVKRGFSWTTFLCPVMWLGPLHSPAPRPLIAGAIAIVILMILIRALVHTGIASRVALFSLAYLGMGLWMGLFANRWRRRKLEKCGWEHIGTLDGRTLSQLIL